MRAQLLCLATVLISLSSWGADAFEGGHFYDETNMRHLTLEKAGFGSTRVIMRSAAEPGGNSPWMGLGQHKDKQLPFAQEVEEGEDRGTFYLATVSESKVDIIIKPGQQKPVDAGLVGTYRRVSDAKLLQLAKKESQAATARLTASLLAATKSWKTKDHAALAVWKEQWPTMRQRWVDMSSAPGKKVAKDAKAPPPPPLATTPSTPAADNTPEHWLKLAEATALGYHFVETLPDSKVGMGWKGEYDDFAGGHVSISEMRDGGLHVTLSFSRAGDSQTGNLDGTAKPEQVKEGKNGELTADFTYADPEVKDGSPPAAIHLAKYGHYVQVETKQAQRYAARGWFDGIYRGLPPSTD